MSECMQFPDTWEEFEQAYGFEDKKEIYTNGSRLIQSFRVKQWLDHTAEPERSRKFLEIVVEYHELCTYPEYEGKPYYAIKYEEKGEIIIGFGTYNPEVLSQYLREYFLPSAEPERKKGEWIWTDGVRCSRCYYKLQTTGIPRYCPNCGAEMKK